MGSERGYKVVTDQVIYCETKAECAEGYYFHLLLCGLYFDRSMRPAVWFPQGPAAKHPATKVPATACQDLVTLSPLSLCLSARYSLSGQFALLE